MKGKWLGIWLLIPAVIACYPVIFLLTGSLMGTQELKDHLGVALGGGNGFISWSILPVYPTLRSYVELLLDSPGFFAMFWNSVKMTGGILAGQMLVGIWRRGDLHDIPFPFGRDCLPFILF